jgi:Sortase and related acyltransferases
MNNIVIRKMFSEEFPLMKDIMYEAVYQPDPSNPYPKDIICLPQVRSYWDNWGAEKDDHCLVALVDNKIAGAVWVRTFQEERKGYGYIDGQTPELAIALFEESRNKGIGTQLMNRMIELLQIKGYPQVSLSITKGNPAVRLYKRLGFKVINENEDDYIMLLGLV